MRFESSKWDIIGDFSVQMYVQSGIQKWFWNWGILSNSVTTACLMFWVGIAFPFRTCIVVDKFPRMRLLFHLNLVKMNCFKGNASFIHSSWSEFAPCWFTEIDSFVEGSWSNQQTNTFMDWNSFHSILDFNLVFPSAPPCIWLHLGGVWCAWLLQWWRHSKLKNE